MSTDIPTPVARVASGAIFGRYVLVEKVGLGAMGEVWVGLDPDLDRKVAIKLVRAERIGRPSNRARLDAEARAMARLTHPNVVTIHDVGELGEQLFIAMEFVDGETLAAWIARGPHPWAEVLAIMRQAAAGLAAAHDVGLVHRDFKPANVMIGRDGRVRVLDFGLARPEGSVERVNGKLTPRSEGLESSSGSSSDNSAPIQGTPAYMSPEQHRGSSIDARSDLFSFCVTLYEALYGVRPFRGNSRLAVAIAVVEGRVVELPGPARERVPEWIRAIVMRGLAGDPQQRFPDMNALLAALERSPERVRRRRLGIAGGFAAVAVVLGFAGILVPERGGDPCAAAGDAITAQWNADARARLRARIDEQPTAAPLAGQRVVEGVDEHMAAWTQASELLCRDRQARRLTERLSATREACLTRQREAVRVLVKVSETEAGAALLEGLASRPFAGLRALGDPTRCVDLAAPLGDRPAPSEDQHAVRAELELGLALVDVEQLPGAALERLADCSDEDLERALLLGRVAVARGDRANAEARLHAVASAATRGEPQLAAQAWLALVELEVEALAGSGAGLEVRRRNASVDRAGQLIDYADALLPERDTASRSQLGLLAGRLALLDEHGDRRALLDRAIEQASAVATPRSPDLLAAMLEVRGRLRARDGDEVGAAADRARAEAVAQAALGTVFERGSKSAASSNE